jgi:hypothetical protein
MKDELQGKLVEILTSIQGAVGKASDFAMVQLPDIAQQYVAYGRAYTALVMAVGVAIFCCGFWAVAFVNAKHRAADAAYAEAKEKDKSEWRGHFFEASDAYPFPFIPFVIGAFVVFLDAQQFMLVWFAPKVWLLKEIAGLLK